MKVLLIGANGQVGRALFPALEKIASVHATTRDGTRWDQGLAHSLNVEDTDSLLNLLDRLQPDVIVNASAYTAVDAAENDEARAYEANARAVAVLGEWSSRRDVLVVHYSTDYVFDGEGVSPYLETNPTNPLGAYGRTKLAGEIILAKSGAPHIIFRTAWVYSAHGKNFLLTMLRLASERSQLSVVDDQIGAPTTAAAIAEASAIAITQWVAADARRRREIEGIYHLVAAGEISWHGFAIAIFDRAIAARLITARPALIPVTSEEYPTPARRPRYSVLSTTKFQRIFATRPAHWTHGLDETISEIARERSVASDE